MYKKLLSLLCVTAILAATPFAVPVSADTTALCGVTDRAEYKNAGYNTQITITFNKEITSTDAEINTAASLVKYGTAETAGNVKTKLESDKKTLNVYLEGCNLAANTKYTLSFTGIESGDDTANVSVNISTGSINENKYVYENFEGYAKGENWTDKEKGIPDNTWMMTPTYNGGSLKKTDSSTESFPSVKGASISSSTHNVSGSYTNAYSDLTVDVRQDPTDAANNVLYYDAGNQQGYDGNLYIRLVKKPNDGAVSVAVPTTAKLVHGFKVYVPADGYSYYTNDYNIGKKNLFGVISNEGNYSDTYTNSMLYVDSNGKLSFRRGKDSPNYRYQTLEADTWYDIKYVANASTGTYDIYVNGTKIADSTKSYRVVRRINGTNGFTVDRSKQLVAKYKIWFENNVPAALGTAEKRSQKIPEFATSASGLDTAMQTNVRAVAASDGTIDNSKVKLQHQRFNGTGTIDTGKWAELTYIITPAAENDTTGKMKYSIYLDGKPLLTDFASDENVWASDTTNRYKLYGFKFNIMPEANIKESGTMYIDDLQMYQTPSFTTATSLSGLVSTAEPITVYFNNAICAEQYDKTTKTIVPFDSSFVNVVSDSGAVIGHPSVSLIDGGYGVELDISALNLTKGNSYKIVFSDDLRDVSYQSFVQPATALTFTPSDSNDVYLSEIADPTVAAASVTAALKISNPTTETKSVWYAVAVYGDYNELIGITSLDPKNPLNLAGGQETENISIAVSAASGVDFTTAAKKVKIFLWDDCVDMNPYGEAEVFSYTK